MKITARAIKRGAAGLLLGAALVLLWDWTAHPIELNMVTLPEQIAAFHNRESEDWDPSEITVYSGVSVGNREYCLMEMGEYLGSVTLERGLTGRYKIEYIRYGDGGLQDAVVENGGRKYFLVGGRDAASQIVRITVSIGGRSYDLENDTPRDHFLLCAEIDSRTEDLHVDRDKIRFYNKDGEDVTGLYDLSGGGI